MRKFQSDELQQQYEKDPSFQKKVDVAEEKYLILQKKANELSIDHMINPPFLEKMIVAERRSIYFLYGFLQPPPGQQTTKLTLNFIMNFKPERQQRYTFVYFNHFTQSTDYFKEFKNIFLMLPFTIIERMEAFILVKPTFFLKAINFLNFTHEGKYFNKYYSTAENCRQLCSRVKISEQNFVSFVPEQYSSQFPDKYKRRGSLYNYRVNLQGQNLTQSQIIKKQEFEKDIKALISKVSLNIDAYQIGEMGVPVILQILVYYFKNRPQHLSTQGLFRKSVSIQQQTKTYEQINNRNFEYIETITDPHIIASLIKRFFFNLQQPIIPKALLSELLDDSSKPDKKQHLLDIIHQLPLLNFMTLAFLIDFLKKDVVTRQKQNKMNATNISICFGPCLMKPEVSSMQQIVMATKKSINYLTMIIDEFNIFFGTDEQVRKMFKHNIEQHNKVFHQTIKEDLHFDFEEEQEQQPHFIVRPTKSYMIKQQHNCQNSLQVQKIDLLSSEIKPALLSSNPTQNIKTKIDEISNTIKEMQYRFQQRKISTPQVKPQQNNNNLIMKFSLQEDETTLVLIDPADLQEPDLKGDYILSKVGQSRQQQNTKHVPQSSGKGPLRKQGNKPQQ